METTAMKKRIITGVLLAAYAIGMLLLGRYAILANLLIMMLIGIYEVVYVLRSAGFRPVAWIHYVTAAAYIPAFLWKGEPGLVLTMFVGVAACMAIAALTRDPSTTDLLATLLPNIYPVYPLIAFAMLTASPAPHWRMLLWLMLLSSVLCDVFALFAGKLLGQRKLMPKVSPNKTVEGAVGGFVGALLAAAIVYLIHLWQGGGVDIWHFLALGVIGGIATQVGDIVASYIKRFCSIKDYGTLFPGHGGLLDRIDGILFNAIAFCVYSLFFLL